MQGDRFGTDDVPPAIDIPGCRCQRNGGGAIVDSLEFSDGTCRRCGENVDWNGQFDGKVVM